jgi:hypothetical protein
MATQALAAWSATPPPFQEFYRLRVYVCAELYRGRASAALAVLSRAEQALRAARLDRFPMAVLEVSLLRARVHLQLAQLDHEPAKALVACEKHAARLDALERSDASGYAALSRAAAGVLRGDRDGARKQLVVARANFARRQMALGLIYVAAAESSLSGAAHDVSRPLAHEVSLRRLGIAEPHAWLALHAPGFDLPVPADPSWRRELPA